MNQIEITDYVKTTIVPYLESTEGVASVSTIGSVDEKIEITLDEKKIEKINIPGNFDMTMKYTVKRRDIDLNFHMHNLYYLDLAYEVLPEEVYEQRPFDNIRITYKREIKLGDTIICKYKKQNNKNIVVITDKENKLIHAIIDLH